MAILGKLQDTRSLSNSMARATDFTKMTTYTTVVNNRRIYTRDLATNLIEFECIEKFVELPVFAGLVQLDVVLLETVQRQFRLVVNENLKWLVQLSEHHAKMYT